MLGNHETRNKRCFCTEERGVGPVFGASEFPRTTTEMDNYMPNFRNEFPLREQKKENQYRNLRTGITWV